MNHDEIVKSTMSNLWATVFDEYAPADGPEYRKAEAIVQVAVNAVRLATLLEAAGMECWGCRCNYRTELRASAVHHFEQDGHWTLCSCPNISAAILKEESQ